MRRGSVRRAGCYLAAACACALAVVAWAATHTPAAFAEGLATPPVTAGDSATPTVTVEPTQTPAPRTIVIGRSVNGRPIKLQRFGTGDRRILIIGGLHGNEAGVPVARAFAAYLKANPSVIASGTEIDIVACANPDGYAKHRRGNARRVDLNRNFPSKDWRRMRRAGLTSGRRRASEPETRAIIELMQRRYTRVVSLHSRGWFTDGGGKGGVALARRIAKKAGIHRVRMERFGRYPGSLGTYAPERYPSSAYVVWELSGRKMTKRVKAGLLEALR